MGRAGTRSSRQTEVCATGPTAAGKQACATAGHATSQCVDETQHLFSNGLVKHCTLAVQPSGMEEKPWESSESERENMNKTHWLAYRQARKQLSTRARNGAEGGGLFQPAEWRKISGEQGATVEAKGKGQADLARAYSNFQGRTRAFAAPTSQIWVEAHPLDSVCKDRRCHPLNLFALFQGFLLPFRDSVFRNQIAQPNGSGCSQLGSTWTGRRSFTTPGKAGALGACGE